MKMRFKQHLNEDSYITDEIVEQINRDCSVFLKESKGFPFYRGSKTAKVKTFKKITPRKDRKPLDTPLILHNEINKEFKKQFGWYVRSEGVFCTGDSAQTNYFGDMYIMLPIGSYKYVWSPSIIDFGVELEYRGVYNNGSDNIYLEPEQYNKIIEDMVETYRNTDLYGAWKSRNEVSIQCKEYYLIKPSFLDIHRRDIFIV